MPQNSNWPKSALTRAAEEPASSRPESLQTGALEHQSTRAPAKDPRVKRPMLRGDVPAEKLSKYKLFCLLYGKEIKEAMEEAWDDLLLKYGMESGALEHQSTTFNDLDDLTDEKKNLSTPSSSLFPEAGAPEHQSPEDQKAQRMLAFYRERTGNQEITQLKRQSDLQAYLQGNKDHSGVSELPEPVIMWGVIQSALLCKSRVNSFSYCLGAIHEAAEIGVSADIVNHVLRTFNERLEGMKAYRAGDEEKHKKAFEEMRKKNSQAALPGTGAELIEGKFRE